MINKPFEKIEKDDIDALISDEVTEGRTLEYKEKLPGNSDGDKIEFLADISSLANASGGDLIFGISENRDNNGKATGIPEKALGLDSINQDEEIRRLENIIRDGIAPRITSLRIKALEDFTKGPLIIIRIFKSWTPPHMITFKSHSRFYSRNSAGKYPLDVSEIRSAFALSESLPQRIRNFRDERIAKIVAEETPVPLNPCPKIILHILPIAALDPMTRLDIKILDRRGKDLQPIYKSAQSSRYNFDGFLTYRNYDSHSACEAYLQMFRNGAIETVDASILEEMNGKKEIHSLIFEKDLILALRRLLALEHDLEFEPPIFVMLSLLGVKGYTMWVNRSNFFDSDSSIPIDRDALFLPDLIIENYDSDAAKLLRPVFDAVWQAAGWDGSKNYDENGGRVEQ
jgi:hypothetical protein